MTPRLFVVTACGQVSGAERVLLDVVETATGRGWTVLSAAPPGPIVEELRTRGVDVLVVPELARHTGRGPSRDSAGSCVGAARRRWYDGQPSGPTWCW